MKAKLHVVIDKNDGLRPALTRAFLNRKIICVTNAHILVEWKCEALLNKDFIVTIPRGNWQVPYLALLEMSKNKAEYRVVKHSGNPLIMVTRATGEKLYFDLIKDGKDGKFPNYKKVMPHPNKKRFKGVQEIGVSPDFINRISQAMNVRQVLLFFDAPHKAIVVKPLPYENTDVRGIVMPVMATY